MCVTVPQQSRKPRDNKNAVNLTIDERMKSIKHEILRVSLQTGNIISCEKDRDYDADNDHNDINIVR